MEALYVNSIMGRLLLQLYQFKHVFACHSFTNNNTPKSEMDSTNIIIVLATIAILRHRSDNYDTNEVAWQKGLLKWIWGPREREEEEEKGNKDSS